MLATVFVVFWRTMNIDVLNKAYIYPGSCVSVLSNEHLVAQYCCDTHRLQWCTVPSPHVWCMTHLACDPLAFVRSNDFQQ